MVFRNPNYLLDHGMIDMVTSRDKIRDELILLLHILYEKNLVLSEVILKKI